MRKTSFFIVLILIFSSCSFYQITSDTTANKFYPSKESPNDVTYLEVITRPHDVIGTITVNAQRHQKLTEVIDQMKKEAAVLGADAITNIRTNAGTGKWAQIKPKKLFGNANIRSNFIADVVVYK